MLVLMSPDTTYEELATLTHADPNADRIEKIRKLLAMAEAKGATDAERDAFQAKANALMIQWSIDDAMVSSRDRLRIETIGVFHLDVIGPRYYSYELTVLVIRIARALGLQGLVAGRGGNHHPVVVGYTSDVDRVKMLTASLMLQALTALGSYVKSDEIRWTESTMKGSERHTLRKSFILGFGCTVADRVYRAYTTQVADVTITTPGTDLVLVDRAKTIKDWMTDNMKIGNGRTRNYFTDGTHAGGVAGHQADIGQDRINNPGGNQGTLGR
jgi:hypothetical protein